MDESSFLRAVAAVAVSSGAAPALAQGAGFQTPGMPAQPSHAAAAQDTGQASRFSAEFNPAFSFVVDSLLDHTDLRAGAEDDGLGLEARGFELGANSWVDPSAWAYFNVAMEDETIAVEELAVHYVGWGGNHTLRAGRFFIDFGKQMQTHVHELRTLERPLALRSYLGDEIKGDGVQWDDWTALGDATVLRWSIGAFASLLPEEAEDFDPDVQAEQVVESPQELDQLNWTARVTGFTEVGERSTLQIGASTRAVPNYALDFAPVSAGPVPDTARDLTNVVYGLDVTYARTDDTGQERWTFGGELLVSTGDTGAEVVDSDGDLVLDRIDVLGETVAGFFVFGDYAWDRFHSAGAQWSTVELPDMAQSRASEVEVYCTRMFSEFHRLRFAVAALESEVDDDSLRVALQYTATLGAHSHGINW